MNANITITTDPIITKTNQFYMDVVIKIKENNLY